MTSLAVVKRLPLAGFVLAPAADVSRRHRPIIFKPIQSEYQIYPCHKNKVADCLTIIQEDMNSKQIEILIPNAKENAQDFILAINEIGPTVDSDINIQEAPEITATAGGSENQWVAF